MDEDELFHLLFPRTQKASKPVPDFDYLAKELKKKGVTLQLLHEEYKKDNPDGYERTQFYQLYHEWAKKGDPVMRFTHKAGEKMFVDFSGDKAHYQDPATGKIIEAELFVSVLGQAPICSRGPYRIRQRRTSWTATSGPSNIMEDAPNVWSLTISKGQ